MSENKQIKLTDSAHKELDKVIDSYKQGIIDVLIQEKFIPGEEIIEITAADVDNAIRMIKYGKTKRIALRQLYTQLFTVIGVFLLVIGLLYPQFENILENPVQLILVITGLYIGAAGLFFYRVMKLRYSRKTISDEENLRERLAKLERLITEKKDTM